MKSPVADWTAGYRQAIADLRTCAAARHQLTPALAAMLDDLEIDAHVIEHEATNRDQKRRLRAAREAELPL